MRENKYENKMIKGENVWAKGDGVIMLRQCFAISFSENSVLLQAWVSDAIAGESDLTGFMGKVPKKKMKGILSEIESRI